MNTGKTAYVLMGVDMGFLSCSEESRCRLAVGKSDFSFFHVDVIKYVKADSVTAAVFHPQGICKMHINYDVVEWCFLFFFFNSF